MHLPTQNILPWKGTRTSQESIAVGHGFDARPEYFEWNEKEKKWDWKDKGINAQSGGVTTVPEGTTITFYAVRGQKIGNDLGVAIQMRRLNRISFESRITGR